VLGRITRHRVSRIRPPRRGTPGGVRRRAGLERTDRSVASTSCSRTCSPSAITPQTLEQVTLTYVVTRAIIRLTRCSAWGALGYGRAYWCTQVTAATEEVQQIARRLAEYSDARILITRTHKMRSRTRTSSTPTSGSRWASPRTPGERIKLLLPYQVNEELVKASKSPDVRFLHCLPALHNTNTDLGPSWTRSTESRPSRSPTRSSSRRPRSSLTGREPFTHY